MNHTLNDQVAGSLPLRVDGVIVNDPVVSLRGEGWFLAIACPWDLVGSGVEFDWETDSFGDCTLLVCANLRTVTAEDELLVDPIFHFDNGLSIVLRADSDFDPWVFSIPGIVLVGRKASPGS